MGVGDITRGSPVFIMSCQNLFIFLAERLHETHSAAAAAVAVNLNASNIRLRHFPVFYSIIFLFLANFNGVMHNKTCH